MTVRNLAFGALAGLTATMAMTMTMRRLHTALPEAERYPLPPREITQTVLPKVARPDGAAAALLAHFGYGAVTGALYACLPQSRLSGTLYGPAVWAVSYFLLLPGTGVLKTADRHPARRNILMILSHAVWGAALNKGLDELHSAAGQGFGSGPLEDTRVAASYD